MQAEYKRDMNHNYLVLYGEKEIDTASYQVRMLVGNIIPSLLKCRMQSIDGEILVYYDITSRQAISSLYEQKKFSMEDLRLIFGGFVQVMEEMSEYLLNPGQLVICPEYMYLDVEKKELFFCYLPGIEKDVRQQFQQLTEYILPKLDHEDGKAVMLGYGVYRRALEDSFHLEHIKEELYQVRMGKEEVHEKTTKQQNTPWNLEEANTAQNSFCPHEENEKKIPRKTAPKRTVPDNRIAKIKTYKEAPVKEKTDNTNGMSGLKKIAACGIAALLLLGILAAKVMGYLPGIPTELLLGAVLVGMGAGMLAYTIRKKAKQHSSEKEKPFAEGINKAEHFGEQNLSEFEKSDWSTGENQQSVFFDDIGDGRAEQKSAAGGQEERRKSFLGHEEVSENFGETVVLSANTAAGPASLVSREPGELAAIYLNEDMTVIGKLETASDAVINLPTVSRVHAKIRKREGEYYLTDLNSRNGTSVNGQMLKGEEEYQLQDQDEVDFAQARYVFLK